MDKVGLHSVYTTKPKPKEILSAGLTLFIRQRESLFPRPPSPAASFVLNTPTEANGMPVVVVQRIFFVQMAKGKWLLLTVQVMVLKDLINASKTSAVRFSAVTGSGYSAGTKLGSVDADELDGLIKSIKLIQSSLLTSTHANYTEVSFTSRGGFEAGCYYSQDKKKWSAYLKLSRFDSNSMVFMSPEELVQVLTLLEQAKARLV